MGGCALCRLVTEQRQLDESHSLCDLTLIVAALNRREYPAKSVDGNSFGLDSTGELHEHHS
jgi:hypothetical protein